MPVDSISSALTSYHGKVSDAHEFLQSVRRQAPLDRVRRSIRAQLAENMHWRVSILQKVSVFSGLEETLLLDGVQRMEELQFEKGDHIILQDDRDDSFFILEKGEVSVQRKANSQDPDEIPRELIRLNRGAYFGEMALVTSEPRSASIVVTSDSVSCARMTKVQFTSLLLNSNNTEIKRNHKMALGAETLETVPMFKSLSTLQKARLLEAMVPMKFLPDSYICRQGSAGNTFYMLMEGNCRVTINVSPDSSEEREVARLKPGDFFGEVALIEASNRRTANVISEKEVSCLTLSRHDFDTQLRALKNKILEHQALRSAGQFSGSTDNSASNTKRQKLLATYRRVTCVNLYGNSDIKRCLTFLKRINKFMMESLWNSMYSRLYSKYLLDPTKQTDLGGNLIHFTFKSSTSRANAVTSIREMVNRILDLDPSRRTPSEHHLIIGMMSIANDFHSNICKDWPSHQFGALCRRLKLFRAKPFTRLIEVDMKGDCAYLILRGCVRVFMKANSGAVGAAFIERDLAPGEVFGDDVLCGAQLYSRTVVSLTTVDLAVIENQSYVLAQDRDSSALGTEEKSQFLSGISLFQDWDSYKLLRLAHCLEQSEVERGTVIIQGKSVSREIKFIVRGTVGVHAMDRKKHLVTTLSNNDYFGESGFLNRFTKTRNSRLKEEQEYVANTDLLLLTLPESAFYMFSNETVALIRNTFQSRTKWRSDRIVAMAKERALLRRAYHLLHLEAAQLPSFQSSVDEEIREILAAKNHTQSMESWESLSDDAEDTQPPRYVISDRPFTVQENEPRAWVTMGLASDDEISVTSPSLADVDSRIEFLDPSLVKLVDHYNPPTLVPPNPTTSVTMAVKVFEGLNLNNVHYDNTMSHQPMSTRISARSEANNRIGSSPSTQRRIISPMVSSRSLMRESPVLHDAPHPQSSPPIATHKSTLIKAPTPTHVPSMGTISNRGDARITLRSKEDIPALLSGEMNRLMATSTCRKPRDAIALQELFHRSRPVQYSTQRALDVLADDTFSKHSTAIGNNRPRTKSSARGSSSRSELRPSTADHQFGHLPERSYLFAAVPNTANTHMRGGGQPDTTLAIKSFPSTKSTPASPPLSAKTQSWTSGSPNIIVFNDCYPDEDNANRASSIPIESSPNRRNNHGNQGPPSGVTGAAYQLATMPVNHQSVTPLPSGRGQRRS